MVSISTQGKGNVSFQQYFSSECTNITGKLEKNRQCIILPRADFVYKNSILDSLNSTIRAYTTKLVTELIFIDIGPVYSDYSIHCDDQFMTMV